MPNADEKRAAVRARYAQIATSDGEDPVITVVQGCCGTPGQAPSSCCGSGSTEADVAKLIGYSEADLQAVPDGANLGLGCGNPSAIAGLKPGETVLDLGSGAGFDCFLAARQVGENGRVIGVDMTPEMLAKARKNAAAGGYRNVEFRLGEIEHLPVADQSVDVIISNCVINLSPEKPQVFAEALRVLKPGGRLAVSDMVTTAELPPEVRQDINLYAACIAGASSVSELEATLQAAGFSQIRITRKDGQALLQTWGTDNLLAGVICPAFVEAIRP